MATWPAIGSEEVPWVRDDEELMFVPKARRRKITPTYRAAIPVSLEGLSIPLTPEQTERLADIRARLARFDEQQARLPFNVPSLLLRSESAASSQIENLTSSARNIALAGLSESAPKNAQIIAANIDAMRRALALPGELTPESICGIHKTLLGRTDAPFAGRLREEQVWVGGTPYSPHEALFVPPVAKRVPRCLDGLCRFAQIDSADPVAKAAIVHAQFETIHPFIDGNGRTGRTLLHRMLKIDGVLTHGTVPVSAGLLHDIDRYMQALSSYQQGDPEPIIDQLADALDSAIVIASLVSARVAEIDDAWRGRIIERASAKIHELPALLWEQPVVDSAYVAQRLGVTRRAATDLINRACSYEILRPLGRAQRGDFYQVPDAVDLLDEISSIAGIRRLMASNGR